MKKTSSLFFFLLSCVFLFAQQSMTSLSVKQQESADGTVELMFTVTINSGWYMYSTNPGGGAIPLTADFESSSDFTLVGPFTELTRAESKFDMGVNATVNIFHNTASFAQKIKPNTDKASKVSGVLNFQICNGAACRLGEEAFSITIPAMAAPEVTASTETLETPGTVVTAINEPPVIETILDIDIDATAAADTTENIWLFLLIALGAGLTAVFTPCVFPMIPMTVGFFLSGKQSSRAAIIRGLIFGFSVTLIYTSIGVLAALFKSASAVDLFSTHWLPNLIFALAFLIFALSFFGGYEISLPTGLANKADRKADSSGYFGAFFVAVALTIISFSCTGPFVGGILVESMRSGLAVKPILGMAIFGFALSSPFMLFAVAPSLMKKLPKSGGWLNRIKVVFAFILLAFSLKFILMFGEYFGWTLISREVFIAVWIVCAVMLGLYFLGGLRLSHDSEVRHTSTVRLLFAIVSFTFALYLLPGLLGAPLPAMSGIIPEAKEPLVFVPTTAPADTSVTVPNQSVTVPNQVLPEEVKYVTPKYKLSHGLSAYHDIAQAIECAKQQNKPVLLSFKFNGCSVCKKMEANVWGNKKVLDILRNKVVIATLYVDDKTELPESEWVTSAIDGKVYKTLGGKLRDYQVSHFGVWAQPFYVLIGFDEKPLTKPVAESSVKEFLRFLNSGIKAFNKEK